MTLARTIVEADRDHQTGTGPAPKAARGAPQRAPKPMTDQVKGGMEQIALYMFVVVPFLALVVAIPVAWGWGLAWRDVAIALSFYVFSGLGITVGFHRHFTHGSFKAKRALRIVLGVAGVTAIEGPITQWVADHRRHHAFSDREGDPHSPWRYGSTIRALAKGFLYAHVGWLFEREQSNKDRFAPDLLADPDIVKIDRLFPLIVVFSTLGPALIGGVATLSWTGALTAFFWGTLVRIALLHHVTWSINSICHTIGDKPFTSRDKSTNFWPLAVLSFGESWHNAHHAEPTCARHGVLPGQIDVSARVIRLFELAGWAYDVRWPVAERFAAKRRRE